jgi:hypothetical protein
MTNSQNDKSTYIFTAIGIAVQLICLFIEFFGDIGFDKPGRYGLHSTHFLYLLLIQLLAFLVIVINERIHNRWKIILAELVAPFVIFAGVFSFDHFYRGFTKLKANDYQHLKGMTAQEVSSALHDSPHGMGGHERYAEHYHGITVVYDKEGGHVTAVLSND